MYFLLNLRATYAQPTRKIGARFNPRELPKEGKERVSKNDNSFFYSQKLSKIIPKFFILVNNYY